MNFYLYIKVKGGGVTSACVCMGHIFSLKASAHSFKQFTSRLLKLSFSLSMHLYNSDGRHA